MRIILSVLLFSLSLIPIFVNAETVTVQGGTNVTLPLEIIRAGESYSITVTPAAGWHFVGETHVEGEGWTKSGARTALFDSSYNHNSSTVYSVHVWGNITKDGEGEGPLPRYDVHGSAKTGFFIKSTSPEESEESVSIFKGESAGFSSYTQDDEKVPSDWTVSGENMDDLTFSNTDSITAGNDPALEVGGYTVRAEKENLNDEMELNVIGLSVKLDPPVIAKGKEASAYAKLIGPGDDNKYIEPVHKKLFLWI